MNTFLGVIHKVQPLMFISPHVPDLPLSYSVSSQSPCLHLHLHWEKAHENEGTQEEESPSAPHCAALPLGL